MNKFEQLVEDLKTGSLSLTHIQMAIRAYIREDKEIPDRIKDLLCGQGESQAGLILNTFNLIRETIGSMKLAYKRGEGGGKVLK